MKDREKYIIVIDGQLIEVTKEVYEVYYKGRRKEQYIMHDLKVGRSRINPETGEKEYIPSREDSYDRLRDVEQQFADPSMDVEGQVINSIMVEKLHAALKFLTPEETELIRKLYYEGISEVQLAKEMGIARTTLQYRKYKVLEKLKELL